MADASGLTSDISSMVDPDELQRLIDLRDRLGATAPSASDVAGKQYGDVFSKQLAQDAVDQASVPGKTAAESAKTLGADLPEGIAEGQEVVPYSQIVPTGSENGFQMGSSGASTAADTAAATGTDIVPTTGRAIVDTAAGGAGDAALTSISDLVAKGALPVTAIYEFLKSTPANENEDEVVKAMRAHAAKQPASVEVDDSDEDEPTETGTPTPGEASTAKDKNGNDEEVGDVVTPTPQPAAPQAAASPQSTLQALLAQVQGANPNAYQEAVQNRNDMQDRAMQMMMGEKFASAFSRGAYKPDYTAAEALLKNAPQSVQDILSQQQAKEAQIGTAIKIGDFNDKQKMDDENSSISQAYRSMAKALSPQLAQAPGFDQMSATAVKDAQPMVDTALKAEALRQSKQAMATAQQDKQQYANEMRVSQQLMQSDSSRAPGGRAQNVIREADNMQTLANQIAQRPDKTPTNQDMVAMSNMYNTILQNGQSTEGGAKALLTPTLSNTMSKWNSYISGGPKGAADNQAFLDQTLNTAKALKQTAQEYSYGNKNDILDRAKTAVHPDWYQDQKNRYDMSAMHPNPSPQDTSGKILVKNTKGDMYRVFPSDLPSAKADGYLPVQGAQ